MLIWEGDSLLMIIFCVQLQAHIALIIRVLLEDRKQKSFLWNSMKLAGFMCSNLFVTLEPHVAH